ncbi:MAG: helicase HerA-like domain-containing protein [Eubacteriales bacterium]|nr:helicase HerA-like domain-containing protein [Christensenellaceae bacterium]MEA5066838.1 helicase HerA-like domain-containing protein [Eubacteriales bacterium]
MIAEGKLWIGQGGQKTFLLPSMANRHGLITGASGTGKTVTLKVMAESFSMLGVPVFLADVKGDLAGMCRPGDATDAIRKRLTSMGVTEFTLTDFPTCFFDVYGERGIPVRTTISEMGPMLLSRLLRLTEAQAGVMNIAFRAADEASLLLLDLKDLRAMLTWVGDNRAEISLRYGNVSVQSVGAILRALIALEDQGGGQFFGEPAIDLNDWMRVDGRGRGAINVLDCVKLFLNPELYTAFMLFLLSELFERLPEAGDLDKPKMVFFFDEAHLLFSDAPQALVREVERVAKLIRSKGVGVYFISQSPSDIPNSVLMQLSNRVQHALRAYTPSDQKAVRAAAQSFRPNPAFDTAEVIGSLGVGEALVSFLDERGAPQIVERAMILPPQSRMGTIDDELRRQVIAQSPLAGKYDAPVDRYSAYEHLNAHAEEAAREEARRLEEAEDEKRRIAEAKEEALRQREAAKTARTRAQAFKPIERAANSAMSSIGRELGKQLMRGLFGTGRR